MKVIVITRDGEYPEQCKAKIHFDKVQRVPCKFLNEYVKQFYRDAISSLYNLSPTEMEQMYKEIFQNNYFTSNFETLYDLDANIFYASKVEEPLNEILQQCKLYANFKCGNYDVWFAFMNEIYDVFFPNTQEPEKFFVKNRDAFIESICQDCGIIDANNNIIGNENILFIHDKEFGKEGEKCLLFNGKWYDNCDELQYKKYEQYFSTIKYFQHNGGIFERIKNLSFVLEEEIEEDRILREKTF